MKACQGAVPKKPNQTFRSIRKVFAAGIRDERPKIQAGAGKRGPCDA